jgi:hypothetical protein
VGDERRELGADEGIDVAQDRHAVIGHALNGGRRQRCRYERIHGGAEGVKVRTLVGLAAPLFWGGVAGRPAFHQRGRFLTRTMFASNTEVDQADVAGRLQHHVGRLEVSYHDDRVVLVQVLEDAEQLRRPVENGGDIFGLGRPANQLCQIVPVDELHHEVQGRVLFEEVDDVDQAGMAEGGQNPSLSFELAGEMGVLLQR